MFALVDTRDCVRVVLLDASSIEEAGTMAFEMISKEELYGCDDLEEYQDSLGATQYYHVAIVSNPEGETK